MTTPATRKSNLLQGLLLHGDGRLKTGRLTVLIVAVVFISVALLFRLKEPITQVQIRVTHLFEAQEVTEIQEETAKVAAEKQEELETQAEQVVELKSPVVPEEKSAPAQTKHQVVAQQPLKEVEPEKVHSEAKPDPPVEVESEPGPSPARQEVAEVAPEENTELPEEPLAWQEPASLSEPPHKPIADPMEIRDLAGEVTLDKEAYRELHRQWLALGARGGAESDTLPLRVENLKESYGLLQMKPVAVRSGRFYDLSDGMRIPVEVLNQEYSSRVFAVTEYDPWDLWEDGLRKAGLKPGQKIEVRYYMYDSIKNAIYLRAGQAFDCLRQSGALPGPTTAAQVDVLGRVFVINRQGGGRFGVFVPLSVDLMEEGRSVSVAATCFAGQGDVALLKEAGLL